MVKEKAFKFLIAYFRIKITYLHNNYYYLYNTLRTYSVGDRTYYEL